MTKTNFNFKRSSRLSMLKRKNFEFSKQINEYIALNIKDIEHNRLDILNKFKKNLEVCASNSLYRISDQNEYLSSHTCKHKGCLICNWQRQKAIRRKYFRFFTDNRKIVVISNGKRTEYVTQNVLQRNLRKYKNYFEIGQESYDLMHLTLTVPHYRETGFRGEKYYYKEIINLFKRLRKSSFTNVFGGEYGVETTVGKWFFDVTDKTTGEITRMTDKEFNKLSAEQKKQYIKSDAIEDLDRSNGLNIHIHSLLMVRRGTQSRNNLYKTLLTEWNNLTYNEYNTYGDDILKHEGKLHQTDQLRKKRVTFNDLLTLADTIELKTGINLNFEKNKIKKRVELIMKGSNNFTYSDILNLQAKGATLIGLETIFTKDKNNIKSRTTEFNSEAMLKAVMETISYHYEPDAFNKTYNKYDIDLIADILPAIRGKHLRGRFGCLQHENLLDISGGNNSEDELLEEYIEEAEQEENRKATKHSDHYLVNPSRVFHNPGTEEIVISPVVLKQSLNLNAFDTFDAIRKMTMHVQTNVYKNK